MIENNPTKIIIHHSADISPEDQFDKINEYHKSKDFPVSSLNIFVGYTYLINHDGKLTQCRLITDEQAHTKGLNFESIGICLEGNFDIEHPTTLQKETLASLLLELCQEFNFDVTDLYLHRNFRNTSCPGANIDENWVRYLYLDYKANQIKDGIQCEAIN